MSTKMIYIDSEGKLKAYANAKPSDFEEFKKNIPTENILFLDNMTVVDIPAEHANLYPIFLKTCLKMWSSSHTFVNPIREEMKLPEPVVEETPKPKKTRKKKKSNGE